jgi:hypothetical protein
MIQHVLAIILNFGNISFTEKSKTKTTEGPRLDSVRLFACYFVAEIIEDVIEGSGSVCDCWALPVGCIGRGVQAQRRIENEAHEPSDADNRGHT